MKCPNCAVPAPHGALECPSCGLVFAKWEARRNKEKLERLQSAEREEREKRAALESLAALEAKAKPAASAANLRKGRILAGVLIAAWIAGLALYYHRWLSSMARPMRRIDAISRPASVN